MHKLNTLIQSGGGTGPMKPGNRPCGMVPNPAGSRDFQKINQSFTLVFFAPYFVVKASNKFIITAL